MDELFRLKPGLTHDPHVDQWFDDRPDELGRLARFWFQAMRDVGDDVLEQVHDGYPTASVADVPFAYVNVFTAHLNVGFFTGAFLDDPQGLLLGTGKRMRHVKVSPVKRVNHDALIALIACAYVDIKRQIATT